jgi:hypothetical protein
MGSRLLPLALATAALTAGMLGLGGLALWLGLLAVPAAAAASFVAISDVLEGRPARMCATTSSLALAFIVLGCAVRSNAASGAAATPLAMWTLVAALFAYAVPAVSWVLEPMKVTRTKPERRRRPVPVIETAEIFEEAA